MEVVVYKGISIIVDESQNPEGSAHEVEYLLTGPGKQWKFSFHTWRKKEAWGHIKNLSNREGRVEGETSALAAVGMQKLAEYAERTQSTFIYKFSTENETLKRWYLAQGREVLGIDPDLGEINMLGRVVGRRRFTPED